MTADIIGRPAVSASQINSARRELVQKLDIARADFFTRTVPFDEDKLFLDFPRRQGFLKPEIRISVNSLRQLDLVDIQSFDMIIMPLSLAEQAAEKGINTDKIAV